MIPLLWFAIAVGLLTFAAMTWFSAKCLFRRGQLPLVIAIMGTAAGTLLINRATEIKTSSFWMMMLSLPLAVSFIIGTTTVFWGQWSRTSWTERSANRLLTFLGISTFAFLTGAALLIVRAEQNSVAAVALTPAFSALSLITSWLGRILWKRMRNGKDNRLSLVGLTLHVLGLGLMGASLVASIANPTVLMVNAAVLFGGLSLFAWQQEEPRIMAAAWGAFAAFAVCVTNLAIGNLAWNQWATGRQLFDALVSGQTGLCLLGVGTLVVVAHGLYQRRAKNPSLLSQVGMICGGSIFLVGCGLALLASIVNRNDVFDTMTATALLSLATLVLLSVCLRCTRSVFTAGSLDQILAQYLPHVASVILLVCLAHGFLWNPTIRDWVNESTGSIDANVALLFALHCAVLAIVASACRVQLNKLRPGGWQASIPTTLGEWSSISNVMALICLWGLVHHRTGIPTLIAIALTGTWLLLVWVQSNHRFGVAYWSSFLTVASGYTAIVFLNDWVAASPEYPSVTSPRFWLIHVFTLSLWVIAWTFIAWMLGRRPSLRRFVDFQPRVERVLALGLVVAMGAIVGTALAGGVRLEITRLSTEPLISLAEHHAWTFAALATLGMAIVILLIQKPTFAIGLALLATWLIAWAGGAEYFAESRSVGSALRWLLPMGGAIGAVLVSFRRPFRPIWIATRHQLGFRGKSVWSARATQILINIALAVVALAVLTISSLAIFQVLMHGGGSALGGPAAESWFGHLRKDISYSIPIGIVVATFLLYAISERRKWLASAGSAVFQYCVILAVFLLFTSPHSKLASSWFVNILQSVSIGMTFYGFTWWYFRDRIEGLVLNSNASHTAKYRVSQIQVHTLINGLLITSLAVLVLARFFWFPARAGDWISAVGGPLGISAWALFGGLVYLVFRERIQQPHRSTTWMWFAAWSGWILVAILAAFVDRQYSLRATTEPWLVFKLITWGGIVVCFGQVILLWLERRPELLPGVIRDSNRTTGISRIDQTIPLLFSGSFVILYCVRGLLFNPPGVWNYLAILLILNGMFVAAGFLRRSTRMSFVAAAVTVLGILFWVQIDPSSWFSGEQPYHVNVVFDGLLLLAIVWSGFYIYRRLIHQEAIAAKFVRMPNLVLLLASGWVLVGALVQWVVEADVAPFASSLDNIWGLGTIVGALLLATVHLWNDGRRFQVISGSMWLIGLSIFVLAVLIPDDGMRNASILLGLAVPFCYWALFGEGGNPCLLH